MIEYQGARIQLLDLPGIVEGASQGEKNTPTFSFHFIVGAKGRGRGRQVVASE